MLEYKRLKPSDEDIVTEFYERYLNSGASIREYVRAGLAMEGFIGYKCVEAETGKVVGMMSTRPGIEFTCGHPELVELVEQHWGKEGVYTGDMIIVDPAYRKHGVGRQMAVLVQEDLRQNHAVCMVMELWLRYREGDVPALHALQDAFDFKVIVLSLVKDFYKNLADYGLTCPECGPDCKCGALITALVLDGPPDEEGRHEKED